MSQYYKSNEIAHAYAHEFSNSGHCPGNGSFSGGIYFSYGTAMAQRITVKGRTLYIVNAGSYSVTTSAWQHELLRALRGTMIHVHGVSMGTSTLFDSYKPKQWAREQVKASLERAGRAIASSKRRRSPDLADSDMSEAERWLQQARLIRELFDKRISIPADMDGLAAAAERGHKAEARRDKAEQKRLAIKHAEQIEEWLAGTGYSVPYGVSKVYLRTDGEVIETSQGASIPYADGERCFRFAIARRSKGWRSNGSKFKVGMYELDAIGPDGIVAGCHHICWAEIERFAKQEGWAK